MWSHQKFWSTHRPNSVLTHVLPQRFVVKLKATTVHGVCWLYIEYAILGYGQRKPTERTLVTGNGPSRNTATPAKAWLPSLKAPQREEVENNCASSNPGQPTHKFGCLKARLTHANFDAISGEISRTKRALPYPARMLFSRSIARMGKKVITYYLNTPFFAISANLAVFCRSVTRLKIRAG